jgi:hypothetical protein
MRRAAPLLCVLALGCDDAQFIERDAGSGIDADVRDSGPPDDDAGLACDSLARPERPTAAPDGDDGNQRLYLLWGIDVFPGTAWMTQGFDLDSVCTEREVGPTSCNEVVVAGDGPRGVDNVYGSTLAGLIQLQHPTAEEDLEALQRAGYLALAVHVEGWNGEANDPLVSVFFAQSECVVPSSATMAACATVPPPPPAWDTRDIAYLGQNSFSPAAPDQPRVVDDAAFVVDGRLVARIPDRENLILSAGVVALRLGLTDATFTATIHPEDGFIEDGMLAGRWDITDILDTTALLGLCPGKDDLLLAQLRLQLENAADIRADPGTDSTGADCDAISAALRFNQGFPATYGGRLPPRPLPMPCP